MKLMILRVRMVRKIALKSSKAANSDFESKCHLDDAEFEKYFVQKFMKTWKNKKAKNDSL